MKQTSPKHRTIAVLAVVALTLAALVDVTVGRPNPTLLSTEARPVRQSLIQLVVETTDSSMSVGVADSDLYHLDPEQLSARLAMLQSLGVTDLRVGVPWVYIEPASDEYDWTRMDTVLATATDMGFTVTASITGTPSWAGKLLAGAPDPSAYADFAGTVATRYGSQITNYEIWNEPNGVIFYSPVSAASYTEMLKAAYTAIKVAQPDATVIAGALAATRTIYGVAQSPQEFLKGMYAAGAAGYFDALSYHPYHYSLPFTAGVGTTNSPLEQVQQLYAIMAANGDGDLQIWATEYGNATTPGLGLTEAEQADLLRDFITGWSRLPYAGKTFIFTTQDIRTGILNHEYNFGLFTSGGSPKEAAFVLAQLIAEIALGELPDFTAPQMSPGRQAYLQLASIVFGLANSVLIVPHFMVSIAYAMMPTPFQAAFNVVADFVSMLATYATVIGGVASVTLLDAMASVGRMLAGPTKTPIEAAQQGISAAEAVTTQAAPGTTTAAEELVDDAEPAVVETAEADALDDTVTQEAVAESTTLAVSDVPAADADSDAPSVVDILEVEETPTPVETDAEPPTEVSTEQDDAGSESVEQSDEESQTPSRQPDDTDSDTASATSSLGSHSPASSPDTDKATQDKQDTDSTPKADGAAAA